jgi:hypothetical protein
VGLGLMVLRVKKEKKKRKERKSFTYLANQIARIGAFE